MSTPEFVDQRRTERRNPRTTHIDVASSAEIVDLMNAEDRFAVECVAECRDHIAKAIDVAVEAFRQDGRLIYVGAGTSGRLGVLDATECPPTFGSDPAQVVGIIAGGAAALTRSQEGAEDSVADGAAAILDHRVTPRDFVIGIAASGTTPFVAAAVHKAQEIGASTGLLTCSEPPPALAAQCDVVLSIYVGPEVLTGSTRLKAGTATKLVLNMITTGAMIRLGKAYGNLMVDLQAMSEKLVDRGERIVMETTGVSRDAARETISRARGSVKVAIVMARDHLGYEEAVRKLSEADGFVRSVVGDPPPVFKNVSRESTQ